MKRLVYRPSAVADLDGIFDYIAVDSRGSAASFVGDIRDHCRGLKDFPKLGPARNDLGKGVRILPIKRRVVVAYRITEAEIVILRVFWGGADYAAIMRNEKP